jgi:hypothetical protein
MTSNLETGYHPETIEKTTKVREITLEVEPLHKAYLSHREPHMSLREFGYLAITWTGRYLANFDYYEARADGNPDIKHYLENKMEAWVNGDTSNPDKGIENLLGYRWSASAIFYREDNAFVLGSKDESGIVNLLRIKAAQNTEFSPVSDKPIEPENIPWINPMLTAKDLDPIADSFFENLEKNAFEQIGEDKNTGF